MSVFAGQRPLMKFVQLYSSPVFEDFRQLLVRPDNAGDMHGGDPSRCDEEKHRFSPVVSAVVGHIFLRLVLICRTVRVQICRGVSDGGKIVWANTCTTKGLVGRSDLALNTAVGVPMCSIGDDLYVLILFSLESLRMSQHAMEFLCASARIVSEPSCCFLPASISTVVTPARVEHFVGLWDMVELMDAYSDEVAFETLSLGRLQNFFDNQESTSLKCIFNDFKQIHNNGFTTKQLDSLRKMNASTPNVVMADYSTSSKERSMSLCSLESGNSLNWALALKNLSTDSGQMKVCGSLNGDTNSLHLEDIKDFSGAFTNAFDHTNNEMGHMIGTGANDEVHDADSVSSSIYSSSVERAIDSFSDYDSMSDRFVSVPIIDVRQSYRKNHSRFHEFMVALMGMTIFDAAELWLLSDMSKDMCVVAALHRNGVMGMWTEHSRNMRLNRSVDVPGHVLESGHPYWDQYYDQHNPSDALHPRALLASTLRVRTAFAIPLPGSDGVGGVLALYSSLRVDVDLVLVSYVVKSLQLLSASSIDSEILAQIDIETVMGMGMGVAPRHQLEKWHVEVPSIDINGSLDANTPRSDYSGATTNSSNSSSMLLLSTNKASVTTVHSASRVNENGAITLTIVSESSHKGPTADGQPQQTQPANTVFTISPMGSLANPRSELATLHAQQHAAAAAQQRSRHSQAHHIPGGVGGGGVGNQQQSAATSAGDGGHRALLGCRMERIRGPHSVLTRRAQKQQTKQQSLQFQNKVENDPSFQFQYVQAVHPPVQSDTNVILNGYNEFQKLQQYNNSNSTAAGNSGVYELESGRSKKKKSSNNTIGNSNIMSNNIDSLFSGRVPQSTVPFTNNVYGAGPAHPQSSLFGGAGNNSGANPSNLVFGSGSAYTPFYAAAYQPATVEELSTPRPGRSIPVSPLLQSSNIIAIKAEDNGQHASVFSERMAAVNSLSSLSALAALHANNSNMPLDMSNSSVGSTGSQGSNRSRSSKRRLSTVMNEVVDPADAMLEDSLNNSNSSSNGISFNSDILNNSLSGRRSKAVRARAARSTTTFEPADAGAASPTVSAASPLTTNSNNSGSNKNNSAPSSAKESGRSSTSPAAGAEEHDSSRLDALVALSSLFQVNDSVPLGLCKVVGCGEAATTKLANLCALHASSRRCAAPDCNKCAQGGTGFCIAHGGGRRCTFPGCEKGARDKFFCAGHGGGKVCML
jgi:hypothetical protein